MISGHGLAEDGRKQSKRLGNYTPPEELIEKYGADSLRYWATGAKLGQNLRYSTTEVEMGHKTVVKLHNVARFLNMHLETISDDHGRPEYADTWVLQELNTVIDNVTMSFDEYAYSRARDTLDSFFWSKFTDYYIEFTKYRLFGDDADSKQAAIHTLKTVLLALLKMYAPMMPFITEEIYQTMYRENEGSKSIHTSTWPEQVEIENGENIEDFQQALTAIDEIRKYKAMQQISLGKEITDYQLETKIDLRKYGEFVSKVCRVNGLS